MATPVNNITLKSDVHSAAVNNLLYQFKDADNLKKFLSILTTELQLIENEVNKLLTLRTLEEATGKQLDNIGETLDLRRTSFDDEIYRNLLKIRNARQEGTSDVESVLQFLRLFTGDPFFSTYKGDNYDVGVYFNDTCNPDAKLLSNIQKFFPVVTNLTAVTYSGDSIFGFDGDDSARGFGSIHDASAGGGFGSKLV